VLPDDWTLRVTRVESGSLRTIFAGLPFGIEQVLRIGKPLVDLGKRAIYHEEQRGKLLAEIRHTNAETTKLEAEAEKEHAEAMKIRAEAYKIQAETVRGVLAGCGKTRLLRPGQAESLATMRVTLPQECACVAMTDSRGAMYSYI
jgi:hypothetical protein